MAIEQPEDRAWTLQIRIISLCIAIVVVNIFLAREYCQFWLIGSSGALVVAISVMVEGWIIFTTPRVDDLPGWTDPKQHTAARVTLVLVSVGTLIQGYGEKLATVLLSCAR
jgi:hypothetical protein